MSDLDIIQLNRGAVDEQIAFGQAALAKKENETAFGHFALANLMLPTDSKALLLMAGLLSHSNCHERAAKLVDAAMQIGLPPEWRGGSIFRSCMVSLIKGGVGGCRQAIRFHEHLPAEDQDRLTDIASVARAKIRTMETTPIDFGNFPKGHLKEKLEAWGHPFNHPKPHVHVFTSIAEVAKQPIHPAWPKWPSPVQILWAEKNPFETITNLNLGVLFHLDLIVCPNHYAATYVTNRLPPGSAVKVIEPHVPAFSAVEEKRNVVVLGGDDETFFQTICKQAGEFEFTRNFVAVAAKIWLQPSGLHPYDEPRLREAQVHGLVPVVTAAGCLGDLITRGYLFALVGDWEIPMAARIRTLLTMPSEEFSLLSGGIRAAATARFSLDRAASLWCETIAKSIAAKKPA